MYKKYPRTPHLPWSEGSTNDDKELKDTSHFEGKRVVVTLKMDGECTTMYSNHIHARSLESLDHPSRHWVKGLHSNIKHLIMPGFRICGENLFAKHSIYYVDLPSYFMLYSVWSPLNNCLPWWAVEAYSNKLDLETVPVILDGVWEGDMQTTLAEAFKPYAGDHEGYVVRTYKAFSYEDFGISAAKYVRKDHVQTDKHWMHTEIIRNKLK